MQILYICTHLPRRRNAFLTACAQSIIFAACAELIRGESVCPIILLFFGFCGYHDCGLCGHDCHSRFPIALWLQGQDRQSRWCRDASLLCALYLVFDCRIGGYILSLLVLVIVCYEFWSFLTNPVITPLPLSEDTRKIGSCYSVRLTIIVRLGLFGFSGFSGFYRIRKI